MREARIAAATERGRVVKRQLEQRDKAIARAFAAGDEGNERRSCREANRAVTAQDMLEHNVRYNDALTIWLQLAPPLGISEAGMRESWGRCMERGLID